MTRSGTPQRREVKVTLAGGRRYDLLVNADDTVAVAPAAQCGGPAGPAAAPDRGSM